MTISNNQQLTNFTIYWLSEQAVTLEFGNAISEDTLQNISRFNKLLHQKPFAGFRTTVPAYTTLTVYFDTMQVYQHASLTGKDCFTRVSDYLSNLRNEVSDENTPQIDTVIIPVCYGGEFGPDLDELSLLHNLTPQQVISLHSDALYKVFMIGFVPGFAYLGGMDLVLETPRKPQPRAHVAAGSVGVAGAQTGIYPLDTPGGWQLIGRTPLRLFDAERSQPSLLKAGDIVQFQPINDQEFYQYTAG